MSLPTRVNPKRFVRIVNYLLRNPDGVLPERAVELGLIVSQHIAGLTRWRLLRREDGKIKLDDRGWCLATGARSRKQIILQILSQEAPYRSALEWVYRQDTSRVPFGDVASHWLEHYPDATGNLTPRTRWLQVLCLFRLCEAVGLGNIRTGRRGLQARFAPDRDSLAAFLDSQSAHGPPRPWTIPDCEPCDKLPLHRETPVQTQAGGSEPLQPVEQAQRLSVFVANGNGKNAKLVKYVRDIVQLVPGIDCEIATSAESTCIPVPDNVLNTMKRCTASVVIVSREDARDESSSIRISEERLIEIGAAFVLYDRRIVLLWETGVPVPSNLQGLHRCEFEGNELSPTGIVQLTDALRELADLNLQERRAS